MFINKLIKDATTHTNPEVPKVKCNMSWYQSWTRNYLNY